MKEIDHKCAYKNVHHCKQKIKKQAMRKSEILYNWNLKLHKV